MMKAEKEEAYPSLLRLVPLVDGLRLHGVRALLALGDLLEGDVGDGENAIRLHRIVSDVCVRCGTRTYLLLRVPMIDDVEKALATQRLRYFDGELLATLGGGGFGEVDDGEGGIVD